MKLSHLTDKQLLLDTKYLAAEDRRISLCLLHHLREIDRRKLFSELGYSSLFNYIVKELGYTDGAATRRINSFRLLQEVPEIEKKIENGKLSLSNLSKAADTFRKEHISDLETKKEILSAIENTSARECDKKLAEIKNPLIPLEPKNLHVISVSVSEDIYQKFEKIRGLFASQRLSKEDIFSKMFEITLKHLEIKRFSTSSKLPPSASQNRYIPAGLRKHVYERDKVCQKCGSSWDLEIDHIIAVALGGKTELENLRLLCRNCNQRSRITSNLHFP